ncbi:hypothetical protein J1N35_041784 [Gossypium stocksii]|uniref:Uncharacterized protein n=1 Tax=Gossypium stocksii TaxID=47602 RepID=A0A9D3UG66_9ROSI|nr:hypothetical protein J1N35_041784 [Gossypium stocksii]
MDIEFDHLNFSKVDFEYLKDITTESLNFDVYHPKGEEWEAFQGEWKQSVTFSLPTTPKAKDNEENMADVDQNLEGHPQTDKVSIEPVDQPNEREN